MKKYILAGVLYTASLYSAQNPRGFLVPACLGACRVATNTCCQRPSSRGDQLQTVKCVRCCAGYSGICCVAGCCLGALGVKMAAAAGGIFVAAEIAMQCSPKSPVVSSMK